MTDPLPYDFHAHLFASETSFFETPPGPLFVRSGKKDFKASPRKDHRAHVSPLRHQSPGAGLLALEVQEPISDRGQGRIGRDHGVHPGRSQKLRDIFRSHPHPALSEIHMERLQGPKELGAFGGQNTPSVQNERQRPIKGPRVQVRQA